MLTKTWEQREVEKKKRFNLLCDGAINKWERYKNEKPLKYCNEQILYFNDLKKK